jgi:hypothetical protein
MAPRALDRVRHYLHSIVILLIYGGLIIIGLLGAITLKLFLGVGLTSWGRVRRPMRV